MKTIYLISTTSDGAARTRSEIMTRAFEQASEYRRCSRRVLPKNATDTSTRPGLRRQAHHQARPKLTVPPEARMTPSNICSTCGNPMLWEICDVCGGKGYFDDVYDLDPLSYDPGDVEECTQCLGLGGWWTCSCSHTQTEFDRTASDTPNKPK